MAQLRGGRAHMGGEDFRPIPGRQAAAPGQEQLYVLRHAGYVLFLRRAAARHSLHDLRRVRHGGQPGHHRGQAHRGVQKGGDGSLHYEAAGRGGEPIS